MDGYVGRILWEAEETATGARDSGTLSVRLADVVIIQRNILKANLMMRERLSKFDDLPSHKQIKLIAEEIHSNPASDEVGYVCYSKFLQLSPAYHLCYTEHCTNEARSSIEFAGGIGPILNKPAGSELTSSDESFALTKGVAARPGESARIRVRQTGTPCGFELIHMIFDGDVSIRISKGIRGPTDKPDWRIKIRKGSEICWPSLIDGKLAPNGYVARHR